MMCDMEWRYMGSVYSYICQSMGCQHNNKVKIFQLPINTPFLLINILMPIFWTCRCLNIGGQSLNAIGRQGHQGSSFSGCWGANEYVQLSHPSYRFLQNKYIHFCQVGYNFVLPSMTLPELSNEHLNHYFLFCLFMVNL